MKESRNLNILVIADINPRTKEDLRNVFIYDYVRCIAPHCSVKLLSLSLVAQKEFTGNKGSETKIIAGGVEVTNFSLTDKKPHPATRPFYYLYWFYKGYQLGKKYKNIDIIHAHGAILQGTISLLLSKKLKTKLIFTEHTGPFSTVVKNGLKKLWAKNAMEKADAVLCVSQHLKNEVLENGIKPKKILVTYNPVDTGLFNILENNPKEKYKNILYTGRLDDFKGGYRALLAFQKIAAKQPEWTLTIIGGGHDFKLIQKTVEADPAISKRVFLRGPQPKEEIAKEMQRSAFFLFPSSHESFGIVIAEAMASGLPVIVGNRAAPKEYVNYDQGLIVDPDDTDEIAKAIDTMIDKLGHFDSKKIRQHVVNLFGLEVFGKKMVDIYEAINK